MRVFATVCETGGFAAAARKLNTSPAAVTRAIVALEEKLGVRLLLRTTRNVRCTDAGNQYFEDVRSILKRINEANDAVSDINASPRGTLSITASVLFGSIYVMPAVVEYMRRYPEVQVFANLVDRVVNFVEEDLDVAIRIGHLADSSLRAIKVAEVRRVLCAAPEYLKANGCPQHPTELTQHTIISANQLTPRMEWNFLDNGCPLMVRVHPRLVVTSNDAALMAGVKGLGITRLLSYQVAEDVENGNLQLLLEDFEDDPLPIHVLHREYRLGSKKVRTFIDHVVETLRANPRLKL